MVKIGVWAGASLAILMTAPAVPDALAQTERGADGLPIYDESLGPPRSRLVDISPVSPPATPAASPVVETPTTAETIQLRPPGQKPPTPAQAAVVSSPPPAPEPPDEVMAEPVPAEEAPPAPMPTVEATSPSEEPPQEEVEQAAAPPPEPVQEPEPEPAAAPEPEEEPTVTAAVEPPAAAPQTSAPAPDGTIAILFPPGGAELPGDAHSQLDSVAAALGADSAVRLQLKAYADGSDGAASAARRLSLSRALSVRGYLIDAGVSSTRIDVRALGAKFETGPADRVDVISVK